MEQLLEQRFLYVELEVPGDLKTFKQDITEDPRRDLVIAEAVFRNGWNALSDRRGGQDYFPPSSIRLVTIQHLTV